MVCSNSPLVQALLDELIPFCAEATNVEHVTLVPGSRNVGCQGLASVGIGRAILSNELHAVYLRMLWLITTFQVHIDPRCLALFGCLFAAPQLHLDFEVVVSTLAFIHDIMAWLIVTQAEEDQSSSRSGIWVCLLLPLHLQFCSGESLLPCDPNLCQP